jgi:hypothetical protein
VTVSCNESLDALNLLRNKYRLSLTSPVNSTHSTTWAGTVVPIFCQSAATLPTSYSEI